MKKFLIILTSILSISLAANASGKTGKSTNSFLPVTTVDKATSTFKWKATKKIGSGHEGNIKLEKASAKLVKGKVMSGTFVMNMDSFDCTDLPATSKKGKDLMGHLKSPEFLDVGKHKTATLTLNKISNGKAMGTLEIKGQKHAITVPYSQNGNTFTGTMTFDRTKYGMVYNAKTVLGKIMNVADKKIIDNNVTIAFTVNLI